MINVAVSRTLFPITLAYTVGSITYRVVDRIEKPYLHLIRAERAAQATFIEALKGKRGLTTGVKRVYHYGCKFLLSIPGVRLVAYFAISFFSKRKGLQSSSAAGQPAPVAPATLDQLWSQGKIEELVTLLEKETHQSGGITWAPKTHLRTVPPLPKDLPTISRFARDLTLEAQQGKLGPVCGREKEFAAIAAILGRNQKSNPILLGNPGVGKTTMAEGIAQQIVRNEEDLPHIFRGKRLFFLQLDRLSIGATNEYGNDSVGKRLLDVVQEAKENRDKIILFIDEIHSLLIGKDKSQDVFVNTLKPMLAGRSTDSFPFISASTPWDFDQVLERDPSLKRRFPQVPILEPSDPELTRVLQEVVPGIEAHHSVHIEDSAVAECMRLSKSYIRSESFPDKAIELLDQAASELTANRASEDREKQLSTFLQLLLQMRNQVKDTLLLDRKIKETRGKFKRVVGEDHIRDIVSKKVGIPLQKLRETEKQLLAQLEIELGKRIIGQEKAKASLAQGVRRARLRLTDPERPAGVFLMLGPTGVGKTASTNALCEILYGSRDAMLRLDMSEYAHSHEVSKLVGSPPGYSGHGQGGKLTNWLQEHPNSIVLLDEIEKADPAVFDLLLGVFGDGRITDGNNNTIRCPDTTFIMTSNLGAREILEGRVELEGNALYQILRGKFKSEFINRIDETIVFRTQTPEEIQKIAMLKCGILKARVLQNPQCPRLEISWDEKLIEFLVEHGYDPKSGARELDRAITEYMLKPLTDYILLHSPKPGAHIGFTCNERKQVVLVPLRDDESFHCREIGDSLV